MTCAVSAAVREGAEAVICASTGNTAASAAAYAARAGLRGAVIVPEGKIATGKLAQALMHGARVIALRGNFDVALTLVRELADRHPIALVNSVNPFRLEGQKTAVVRDRRRARRGARRALHPGRQRRQHHRLLEGLQGGRRRAPRMLGFQAAGAAPLVHGERRRESGDGRERDPHRQPGALGGGDGRDDALARRGPRGHRRRDPRRLPLARRARGRLLRAGLGGDASPGCCKHGADGAERDRLRAHRPRPQGPETALDQAGSVVPCEPEIAAVERAVLGLAASVRRRLVRVPASSANLGPGFDVLAAALALHLEVEVRGDRALRASTPTSRSRATAATSSCAASSACTRRTTSTSASAPRSRCRAGSARARRRSSPGCWPPTTCSSSTPTCSRWPPSSRATPTTSRPRCSAASSSAPTARVDALRPAAGLEAVLVVPHAAVPHPRGARRAARGRCRWPTRSSTSRTSRCWCSGWRAATGTSSRAGSHDRLHQPHRAHLYPRSVELVDARARRSARSARRSPAPGRPCSCGATTSRPARCWTLEPRRRVGRRAARAVRAAGRDVRALESGSSARVERGSGAGAMAVSTV